MGGVVYTAEVTLKNVPQDYKLEVFGTLNQCQII
jgi:hypothetical protein